MYCASLTRRVPFPTRSPYVSENSLDLWLIRTYAWYVNLKPGSVHDFEQHVSLFNSKFFCAEAKFSFFWARLHMPTFRRIPRHIYEKVLRQSPWLLWSSRGEIAVRYLSPRYNGGISYFPIELIILFLFQSDGGSNSLSQKRFHVATLEKGEWSKSFILKKPTQDRRGPKSSLHYHHSHAIQRKP